MASKAIADLTPLATTLNAESNDINKTISTISGKLASLNLGLEVWCDFDGYGYGFARINEVWQLGIKWQGQDVDPQTRKLEDVTFVEPLFTSSREERINGLKHLPHIIDLLKAKAEATIATIREAKEFAANVGNGVGSVSGLVGHPVVTQEDVNAQGERRKRGKL